MTKKDLIFRFKQFALDVVQLAEQFPQKQVGFRVTSNQMVRSSTSSASNYRAACRGRSTAEFLAKLGIVEEELDETQFWLEFSVGLSEKWRPLVTPLWREANELLSITVASINTGRKNQSTKKTKKI